jgi:uncharacterized phage-associated protein
MPTPQDLIADYLLCECRERGELLTNLKLQKLLFYAQAWHLALKDSELFSEDFQAWVHGPVLLSQYHRFKEYKWHSIAAEISKPELDPDLTGFLDEIVDIFGSETAVALEIMTHKEPPWREARGDLPPHEPCNSYISKQTMTEYYRSLSDA